MPGGTRPSKKEYFLARKLRLKFRLLLIDFSFHKTGVNRHDSSSHRILFALKIGFGLQ